MGFYNNIGGMSHPTTRDELLNEVKIRLNRGQTNLNDIDTSKITDMSNLFFYMEDKKLIEDIDISLWDVSNVKDMAYMCFLCSPFNCDLSGWDVSNVVNMSYMF